MAVSLTSALSLLPALLAVIFYFQLECSREREERLGRKFNEEYQPEQSDCQAEIGFFKTDSGLVSVTLGKSCLAYY